jgi:hypothetical protein
MEVALARRPNIRLLDEDAGPDERERGRIEAVERFPVATESRDREPDPDLESEPSERTECAVECG